MRELHLSLNHDTRNELQALADAHGMPAESIAAAFITDGLQGYRMRHTIFDDATAIDDADEGGGAIWGA